MTLYSDVFERKEMKYLLDRRQRDILEARIRECMVKDVYSGSSVSSLYYDTPDFALIERSLDKPVYKEKIRLRAYDSPCMSSPSFVELKKKYKGIVYKRRIMASLRAAQLFLQGEHYEHVCRMFPLQDSDMQAQSLSLRSFQIAREIAFSIARYDALSPSFLITCKRSAYASPDGDGLRITFDDDLACDYDAHDLLHTIRAVPLLSEGHSILEVKNAGPLPQWLLSALNEAQAYPQSFSKYGRAYMNLRKDD